MEIHQSLGSVMRNFRFVLFFSAVCFPKTALALMSKFRAQIKKHMILWVFLFLFAVLILFISNGSIEPYPSMVASVELLQSYNYPDSREVILIAWLWTNIYNLIILGKSCNMIRMFVFPTFSKSVAPLTSFTVDTNKTRKTFAAVSPGWLSVVTLSSILARFRVTFIDVWKWI